MKLITYTSLAFLIIFSGLSGHLYSYGSYDLDKKTGFKNVNGRLYAYIVLLFNENPHFVNMIQQGTVPAQSIGNEGFHIREYKRYLRTLAPGRIRNMARLMLTVYLEPTRYTERNLRKIEKSLETRNIILRFSKNNNRMHNTLTLDYCIYARKELIQITHPLLKINERIYNIQPFIFYDEFSTSNSTFYYDMIYINPEEVHNDSVIAYNIVKNNETTSRFFVGSPVTGDVEFCLKKAFGDVKSIHHIRKDIWEMFVIHELTHKTIHNDYNHFDQVTGEELSLSSNIYANPYLGLSVMYSYLKYNAINPHRIAATNYISFLAEKTGNNRILDDPSLIKYLPVERIRDLTHMHFTHLMKKLKLVKRSKQSTIDY